MKWPIRGLRGLTCWGLLALIGGCQLKGPARSYAVLGAEAQELRDAFNADTGMVRVVLLVAPT